MSDNTKRMSQKRGSGVQKRGKTINYCQALRCHTTLSHPLPGPERQLQRAEHLEQCLASRCTESLLMKEHLGNETSS